MKNEYKIFFLQKITNHRLRTNSGFGLIEILIASAVILVAMTTLSSVVLSAFRITDEGVEKIQAEFLAGEGLEVVRLLRDKGWEANIEPLSSGTVYYPVWNVSTIDWTLDASDPGLIDGTFTRVVIFEDVYRRLSDDDIVPEEDAATKALDSGTKKVTSRVSWKGRASSPEVRLEMYITNFFDN